MSQSGALCTSYPRLALADDIGFSRFVSLGNKADLNEIDFLQAWGDDPNSKVIIAYLEGITDGGRFIEIARQVSKHKPVIAIKSGTTDSRHAGPFPPTPAPWPARNGPTRPPSSRPA